MSLSWKPPAVYDPAQMAFFVEQLNRELAKLLPRTEHIVMGLDQKLIIRSPNGHYWEVGVSDLGAITTTDLGTGNPL
jgi:hypothetical protein